MKGVSNGAYRSTAYTTVEPLPTPSTILLRTNSSTAACAAFCFAASTNGKPAVEDWGTNATAGGATVDDAMMIYTHNNHHMNEWDNTDRISMVMV
jgi:hypothetical protein